MYPKSNSDITRLVMGVAKEEEDEESRRKLGKTRSLFCGSPCRSGVGQMVLQNRIRRGRPEGLLGVLTDRDDDGSDIAADGRGVC